MPWVLLATERALRSPRLARVPCLATVTALQLLAGSADACAMTWALAGAWVLFRLVGGPRARVGRALLVLAASAPLAAGTAAVVWLPASDVVSRATRSDLPADVRTAWSLPPLGLARIVAPLDPGRVPAAAELWRRLYDRPSGPLLSSFYLGVGFLGLVVSSLSWPRSRRAAVLLVALAVAAVVFAMGPHTPVHGTLAGLVPPLRVFRYPSKAMLVAAFALAMAAVLSSWLASLRLALVPSLLAAGVATMLWLARSGRLAPRFAAVAATLVCAADLLAAHTDLNATAPASLLLAPPRVAAEIDRSEGRRLYVYEYQLPGASQRLLGRADAYRSALPPAGVDPRVYAVIALRQYLVPPSAGLFGLQGSYDLDLRGLYPRDLNDLTFGLRRFEGTPIHARLLRMGAVGTVLSLHERGLEDLQLVDRVPSLFPEPIHVWRVPGARPRAWLVGCARVADGAAAFWALAEPGFEPAHEVIVPSAPAPVERRCGEPGTARVVAYQSDRVRLQTEAERAAYLVLANAWDPGWRVTLDGKPARLLRADLGFRAVAVPQGRHEVEMVYRPRSVELGLGLSLASILAAIALMAFARVRRARAARTS